MTKNDMMKYKLLAAACLLATAATAQTEVSDYHPGVTEEGITYFLPDTHVQVVVKATRVHHDPGEFCQYAERYLRLQQVPQVAYDEWTLDGVTLSTFGRADKSRAYTVRLKQKTSAPLVGLSQDGRLLSINTEATVEPALQQPSVVKEKSENYSPDNYKTQEILSAGSTSKMAELTAGEIYDIRENRGLLAKGQADFMPKDGEQLRLMLASLDTQEEGLLKLFTGTQTRETHTFVFDVLPKTDGEKVLLMRFSKYLGVVDSDDPAGEAVFLSVTDLKTLPEVAVDPKAKAKKDVEDVRYAVPGRASVSVFTDDKELASQSFPMAQFGRVEHLGADLFNKKMGTRIQFYPETGGIAKVEGEM